MVLIAISLGIAIGWYAERLLRYVTALLEKKPVTTGVVRTEVAKGAQPTGAVVKSKSPKEVAAERDREFRETFEI